MIRSLPLARPPGFVHVARLPPAPFRIRDFALSTFAFALSTFLRIGTGGVTFIPQNVRWEDGTVSFQEILRWKGDGTHATYEAQTCTGDPTVEANWHYRGSFTGGKAVLDGFTPGTIIWGRVRKIGTGGEVGDWSDPAQFLVH